MVVTVGTLGFFMTRKYTYQEGCNRLLCGLGEYLRYKEGTNNDPVIILLNGKCVRGDTKVEFVCSCGCRHKQLWELVNPLVRYPKNREKKINWYTPMYGKSIFADLYQDNYTDLNETFNFIGSGDP